MERFKVTNTTVKAPRKDKHGKDLRSTTERVGHPVQFRDENDRIVTLQAGSATIVGKVDGGLLGLQRGGFIQISKVEDIAQELKAHSFQERPSRAQIKQQMRSNSTEKTATVSKTGFEKPASEKGEEYEGAVNPDGAPNFLVTAKRGGNRRSRKKGTTDATAGATSHKADE